MNASCSQSQCPKPRGLRLISRAQRSRRFSAVTGIVG